MCLIKHSVQGLYLDNCLIYIAPGCININYKGVPGGHLLPMQHVEHNGDNLHHVFPG